MARVPRRIYQLKIGLYGAKPPIWRRFLIASSVTLPKFHEAIQIIMGWTDSHLHIFETGDRYYGVLDPEWDDDEGIHDETKFRLNQLLWYEKDYLKYVYDMGDEWVHKITLEKILPFDSKLVLPFCVKAKGACPPEDVGGLWGYYQFLEIMRNPNHPEYEEYKKWIGGEFDSAAYDIDGVNRLLADIGR